MRPLEVRFWEKVDRRGPDECWPWLGSCCGSGYGRIWDRRIQEKASAHRISWELAHGLPPRSGMNVCHHCDNPPCVNPAHLFLGTQAQNLADMHQKGRAALGESNGQAKLTEAEVQQIYTLGRAGRSKASIAREFGVSRPAISFIISGKRWTRVTSKLAISVTAE